MEKTVNEIAALVGGTVSGDGTRVIRSLAALTISPLPFRRISMRHARAPRQVRSFCPRGRRASHAL